MKKLNKNLTDIERKPAIQIRWLLTLLGFAMYFLSFMVKNSFGVAIVAMVNSTIANNEESNYGDVCEAAFNKTEDGSSQTDGEFFWTDVQQGQILVAYMWGNFLSRMLGGRLGEVYGQRLVIAVGLFVTGLLNILCPTLASAGPYALFAIRFLLGCCSGPMMSAFQSLISKWAPRHQLSSMINIAFTGVALGSMIGVVTAGITAESWGWKWIFWSEGILVLIFVPFWIFFVRNDPDDHPYVTPYESKILEENRNVVTKKTVPWKQIFKSSCLYVCIVGQFANSWSEGVQNADGPIFYNSKLGLDLSLSSWVIGTTSLVGMPFLVLFGWLSDMLIRRKYFSRLVTRKIMHFIGAGILGFLYLAIGLADCKTTLVITIWIITGAARTATCSSFNVSIIDFAPNYAGTVMGLIGIGNIGSAISPIVISALIQKENGWNNVFYSCAAINFISCFVYILFITDQPQSWNYDDNNNQIKNTIVVSTIPVEDQPQPNTGIYSTRF